MALFALMSLVWGSTWLAMKFGVASVPPVFFGGTRFVAAGLVLLLIAWRRQEWRCFTRAEWGRLVLVQGLMVVLTYSALFWAIRYVPSGLAAVLDLGADAGEPAGFRRHAGRRSVERPRDGIPHPGLRRLGGVVRTEDHGAR